MTGGRALPKWFESLEPVELFPPLSDLTLVARVGAGGIDPPAERPVSAGARPSDAGG